MQTTSQDTEVSEVSEVSSARKVLASYLGVDANELKEGWHDYYGLTIFAHGKREYAVGTDSEAQDAATKNIKGSIWAFNASFILAHCGLPSELEEAIHSFQEKKCESANDALLTLVEKCGDLDEFVSEAICADGRGHFLSSYDGEENEVTVDDKTLFVYQVN